MISYGKQDIDENDIAAVVETLKSEFLTQGPKVIEFEKAICSYIGAKYSIAVANGTAALHLAVACLQVGEGREGVTSTNTFTATASSMVYNKLKPVFADIDSRTFNVTPDSLKAKTTANTSLYIPVHFAGQPCQMKEIKELADTKNIQIIEDAAHAIGSVYEDGSKVGNCKYSDLTIFSFHPVKTITTGEGGLITTNDEELYERLISLRSHGITKDQDRLSCNPGPWYYEMQNLGFNYRITDFQAALGLSQLAKLEAFKARRREIIQIYNYEFNEIEWLSAPFEREGLDSCFHLYVVQIDFERIGKNKKSVIEELFKDGIGTQVHYIPVHSQPFYQKNYGTRLGDCPVAEAYYEQALSLPLYPGMSKEDVSTVVMAVKALSKNEGRL